MEYVAKAVPALPLPDRAVQLWSVDLNRKDWRHSAFNCLAADEQDRAMRFHFERDRRRFSVARAALREILGLYLRRAASDIVFCYGANGKPCLAGAGPQFNLAHSEELAVIACSASIALGVDVEQTDREIDLDILVEYSASAMERAAFAAMPPDEKRPALFRWWTRKEALLKALGNGLSLPLDGFDVSIAEADARLTGSRLAALSGVWSLCDIFPAPSYIGSLATAGPAVHVESFTFVSQPR